MVCVRGLRGRLPLGASILVLAGVAACSTSLPSSQGSLAATRAAPTGSTSATTPGNSAGAQSGQAKASGRASTTTSASSAAAGLSGMTVVLDPGHNGGNAADPSAVNALVPMGGGQEKACDTTGTEANDGYQEHAFNFDVSERVATLLRADGITVILTRSNDTGVGPCVNVRAAIGNNAHANAAVSIHADGYDGNGHGFQILEAAASAGGAANDTKSHDLAVALHGTFLSESGLVPATYIGTDGYETRDDLAGLNLSTVPKVLVECGNMRDAGDAALEESTTGRQNMAKAIADGIIEYLHSQG